MPAISGKQNFRRGRGCSGTGPDRRNLEYGSHIPDPDHSGLVNNKKRAGLRDGPLARSKFMSETRNRHRFDAGEASELIGRTQEGARPMMVRTPDFLAISTTHRIRVVFPVPAPDSKITVDSDDAAWRTARRCSSDR